VEPSEASARPTFVSDIEDRLIEARNERIRADKNFQLASAKYYAVAEEKGWTREQADAFLKETIERWEVIHKLVEAAPPEHYLVFADDKLVFHSPDKDAAFKAETAALRKGFERYLVFVMPPKAQRDEWEVRRRHLRR
jgi:hypothetical protein